MNSVILNNFPQDAAAITTALMNTRKNMYSYQENYLAQKEILEAFAKYCYELGFQRCYKLEEEAKKGKK